MNVKNEKKILKCTFVSFFSNMTLTRLMSKHKGGMKHGLLCYALLCSRFEIFSISISSNFKIGKCFIVLIFWKHVFYFFFFYTNMIFYVLSTSVEILKKIYVFKNLILYYSICFIYFLLSVIWLHLIKIVILFYF